MTLYVDKNYYIQNGGNIPLKEIDEYLELSQEKIDSITHNRIVSIGFDNLTEFQKEKVKKAICIQADYIKEHGFNDEEDNDISSYSVLDISVNVKDSSSKETKASKMHMSERAYNLIHKTGLDCPII